MSDGTIACFECVESRTSARACVHFDVDTTIQDENTGEKHSIPPERRRRRRLLHQSERGDARSRSPRASSTSLRGT